MIVPMKKITVLCLAEKRQAALHQLEKIGVLHLVPCAEPQESGGLEEARRTLARTGQAVAILNRYLAPEHQQQQSVTAAGGDIVERCHKLVGEQKSLSDECTALERELARCSPLGRFDPQTLNQLKQRGLFVKVYKVPVKNPPPLPQNAFVQVLSEERGIQWLVLAADTASEYPADEFDLPKQSIDEMRTGLDSQRKRLAQIEDELTGLAHLLPEVNISQTAARNRLAMEEARSGMGQHEQLAYLTGFCPEPRIDELKQAAAANGWGLVIDAPETSDNVPTLVEYPRIVKPIKAVFDMLQILPGYREADISAVFLIFFSIFFAMLIGDAGYGLLFMLATLAARRKFKTAPSYPFVLLGILSTTTMLWGIITGNYFGIPPEVLPAFMQGIRVPWLLESDNIMQLCFVLGAVHLTIAHIWNAVICYPDKRWLAQTGWIGLVWTMFILASAVVLGNPLPIALTAVLFGGGIVLVAGFMTPPADLKKDWINHAMLPLNVVSCFVDVVSYIRLFAVGMASLQVARSFNDMAVGVGMSHMLALPISALILLLGHGLNIMLCGLGILVHGVRLNTLEFSLHKQLEWAGSPYKPFGAKE